MSEKRIVTVTYEPKWRASYWTDTEFTREAWFVSCSEHPYLGKDSDGEPWGYATSGIAGSVATRHRNAYHGGQL